jgi:hypothetical protein
MVAKFTPIKAHKTKAMAVLGVKNTKVIYNVANVNPKMMVLLYNFQLPEDLILFSVKYASILERKVEKNWAFLPSKRI